jgi:soluble lytic murein transglycosylase-like protein
MTNVTKLAAAGAAAFLCLTTAQHSFAAETENRGDPRTSYEASAMGRFLVSVFGQQEKADASETEANGLVSDNKAEALAASTQKASVPYGDIVSRYAAQYGISEQLVHAVIRVESNYRPNARGRAGEIGLMQIKPSTARGIGFSGNTQALYDPEINIRYGMKYLARAYQLAGGDLCGTILRYNAGHGATRMNGTSSAYCARVKRMLGAA